MLKQVPSRTFGDFRKGLPSLETFMFYSVGLMLVFLFAVTFIANQAITGYSVAGSAGDGSSRFAGSSSVLLVIFAAFAFFIFILAKRMDRK